MRFMSFLLLDVILCVIYLRPVSPLSVIVMRFSERDIWCHLFILNLLYEKKPIFLSIFLDFSDTRWFHGHTFDIWWWESNTMPTSKAIHANNISLYSEDTLYLNLSFCEYFEFLWFFLLLNSDGITWSQTFHRK